jgi:hypothetical protein
MSDIGKIEFLKGSLRYKQATDVSLQFNIPLSGKIKELDETQRQASVNLVEVYNDERQKSALFLPSCKFQLIFSNSYSGFTETASNPYPPINNNLYYTNPEETKKLQVLSPTIISWPGLPQYNEFNFIRTDYNVDGYTTGANAHVDFLPFESSRYNWAFYMTYVSGMDDQKSLTYDFNDGLPGEVGNWILADGIPFRMSRVEFEGKTFWQFKTPFNHNLQEGDYVRFTNVNVIDSTNTIIPGRNVFRIYNLGNGVLDSEKTIFNIVDVGYIQGPNSFQNNKIGTFYRVIDNDNVEESSSRYYIRVHTILTNFFDAVLTNSGFEQNAFQTRKRYETQALTPNFVSRISVIEGSQSYNLSFNSTINLDGLVDNLSRPVSEIFFTVVNRGFFGYFNPPTPQGNGLKEGWEFNIKSIPTTWWERNNPNSDIDLQTNQYTNLGYQFYYNNYYNRGNQIYGDVCEWNDITQEETVLSKYYHKFVFNPQVFNINTSLDNPSGYYYTPHFSLKIKEFSDYIEQGDSDTTVDVPNYAFYSKKNNNFYWRDIYNYGFIDSDNRGVNFPFLNGRHYPYSNYVFRIIPEGRNVSLTNIIPVPTIDGCE